MTAQRPLSALTEPPLRGLECPLDHPGLSLGHFATVWLPGDQEPRAFSFQALCVLLLSVDNWTCLWTSHSTPVVPRSIAILHFMHLRHAQRTTGLLVRMGAEGTRCSVVTRGALAFNYLPKNNLQLGSPSTQTIERLPQFRKTDLLTNALFSEGKGLRGSYYPSCCLGLWPVGAAHDLEHLCQSSLLVSCLCSVLCRIAGSWLLGLLGIIDVQLSANLGRPQLGTHCVVGTL